MDSEEKGFIKTIILVIIGFVILKYFFGFDAIAYLKSDDFLYYWNGVSAIFIKGWNFISGSFGLIWEIFKKAFYVGLEFVRNAL